MLAIEAPMGWRDALVPALKARPRSDASYLEFYNKANAARFSSYYSQLGNSHRQSGDDVMSIGVNIGKSIASYQKMIFQRAPMVAAACKAYRGDWYFREHFDNFVWAFEPGTRTPIRGEDGKLLYRDPIERRHMQDPAIDIRGRNSIPILHPANFWDRQLCNDALGITPEEVIRRLDGLIPMVRPVMDGVYTVFSDDPNLSHEGYAEIQHRFRPLLGIH